jgi:hypothetical protein
VAKVQVNVFGGDVLLLTSQFCSEASFLGAVQHELVLSSAILIDSGTRAFLMNSSLREANMAGLMSFWVLTFDQSNPKAGLSVWTEPCHNSAFGEKLQYPMAAGWISVVVETMFLTKKTGWQTEESKLAFTKIGVPAATASSRAACHMAGVVFGFGDCGLDAEIAAFNAAFQSAVVAVRFERAIFGLPAMIASASAVSQAAVLAKTVLRRWFKTFFGGVVEATGFWDVLIGRVSKVSPAAKRSLEDSTLDSLTEAKTETGAGILVFLIGSVFGLTARLAGCPSVGFGVGLGASTGERGVEFFTDFKAQGIDEVNEPQIEDAFVLVDFMEEVSDTGEDWPDEVGDEINGLSGLTDDSEIQWCSDSELPQPFQSLSDDNEASGSWLGLGLHIIDSAAGTWDVVREAFNDLEKLNKPSE